jgi:hypothetical protein
MKKRSAFLAVLAATALAVSAAACSSDSDEGATTTTTVAEATTTTAAESTTAPCTEQALTLAGAASGPDINFDKVTEFECDGGYAYAWFEDSSKTDSPKLSEIFKDEAGTWEPVTGPLCDGTAAGNVPTEILTKGCEHANAS